MWSSEKEVWHIIGYIKKYVVSIHKLPRGWRDFKTSFSTKNKIILNQECDYSSLKWRRISNKILENEVFVFLNNKNKFGVVQKLPPKKNDTGISHVATVEN